MNEPAFDSVYPITLAFEKGYSNNPLDPGGSTFDGITQATYDGYRANKSLPSQDVRLISDAEKYDLYRSQYWLAIKGDGLPVGLSLAVYDFAVNSGPVRAIKELQRVVGVAVDGAIGQRTIAAANAAMTMGGALATIQLYCERRLEFCKQLKTFSEFGVGWTRRIEGKENGVQEDDIGIVDYAFHLALASQHPALIASPANAMTPTTRVLASTPTPIGTYAGELPGKAADASISALRTTLGRGVVLSSTGIAANTLVAALTTALPHISNDTWMRLFVFSSIAVTACGVSLMVIHYLRRKAEKSR